MRVIIAAIFGPRKSSLLLNNQTENKYVMTRANMSTATNDGFKMRCKAVTANLFEH